MHRPLAAAATAWVVLLVASSVLVSSAHAHRLHTLGLDPGYWLKGRTPQRPAALDDNATAVHCYRHVLEGDDISALNEAPEATRAYQYVYHFALHGQEVERAYKRRLYYAEIEQVEWGAVLEDHCTGALLNHSYSLRSDATLYSWAGDASWQAFARMPVPCRVQRAQRYGVASNSARDWGGAPVVRDDALVYAPVHGLVPMDAPWSDQASVAEPGSTEHYLTLAMRQQSTSVYPLQRLVVRKCIALLELLSEDDALALEPVDETAVWRTRDLPMLSTRVAPSRVLLLRSSVQRESDATCSVWVGYAYTPVESLADTEQLDIVSHQLNHLSAAAPSGTQRVTRLQSGTHRNVLHVRWMCEHKLGRGFRPLAWTLGDQHLVMLQSTVAMDGGIVYTLAYARFESAQSSNSRLELVLNKQGQHASVASERRLRPAEVGADRTYTPEETKSLIDGLLLLFLVLAVVWAVITYFTGNPQVALYSVVAILLFVFLIQILNALTYDTNMTEAGQIPLEQTISEAEQLYGTDLPGAPYADPAI